MADLNMTSTRVAVLRAVAAGKVARHHGWTKSEKTRDVLTDDSGKRTVTKTCNELAGVDPRLIRPGRQTGLSLYSPQLWQLTPAGAKALAELDGKER